MAAPVSLSLQHVPARRPSCRAVEDGTAARPVASSDCTEISRALVDLVNGGGGMPSAARNTRVKSLIEQLEARQEPLSGDALRGPWEVVWSEGTMAWRALVASCVQRLAGKCRAGQCFHPSAWTAMNFAELFDKRITITAEGTFSPAEPTGRDSSDIAGVLCPVQFKVSIAEGALFYKNGDADSKQCKLPISGPGTFEILYGDSTVRIFRSSGGLAVQVPSDWKPPS
eukprot:CAMPEP_0117694594 /NCGR_PEP_ID=MMETSP0804-20121206/27587_1 /TAXON_ID=1074897 /ORGANISM="Tetraselmis astigmatica, Strain CCMP880" /LENGTH=226 /DNA_ID=CAMNT_0005508405 /DNA_START=454 /DNA_END=1131 /DNA_ORIENTATION=-